MTLVNQPNSSHKSVLWFPEKMENIGADVTYALQSKELNQLQLCLSIISHPCDVKWQFMQKAVLPNAGGEYIIPSWDGFFE